MGKIYETTTTTTKIVKVRVPRIKIDTFPITNFKSIYVVFELSNNPGFCFNLLN